MNLILDTNVLVRLVTGDDEAQQAKAAVTLDAADKVAISVHAFCEFAWVLQTTYKVTKADIAFAIRGFLNMKNVLVNQPAIQAGLSILDAGGDFADGVIAYDGKWLGGATFASFDKRAVALLEDRKSVV